MSDNDVEELLNAIDKHTNAIRAELRAVDQGDSTTTDPGDSAKTDQVDKEFLGTRDLEALTGTKAGTWRYWASIGQGPASFKLGRRQVWKMSVVREWLAEQEKKAR
jgi:prophage regulatory protein